MWRDMPRAAPHTTTHPPQLLTSHNGNGVRPPLQSHALMPSPQPAPLRSPHALPYRHTSRPHHGASIRYALRPGCPPEEGSEEQAGRTDRRAPRRGREAVHAPHTTTHPPQLLTSYNGNGVRGPGAEAGETGDAGPHKGPGRKRNDRPLLHVSPHVAAASWRLDTPCDGPHATPSRRRACHPIPWPQGRPRGRLCGATRHASSMVMRASQGRPRGHLCEAAEIVCMVAHGWPQGRPHGRLCEAAEIVCALYMCDTVQAAGVVGQASGPACPLSARSLS